MLSMCFNTEPHPPSKLLTFPYSLLRIEPRALNMLGEHFLCKGLCVPSPESPVDYSKHSLLSTVCVSICSESTVTNNVMDCIRSLHKKMHMAPHDVGVTFETLGKFYV